MVDTEWAKDRLTGFMRREEFLVAFAQALEKARTGKIEEPLSLAMTDLDHFKAINDNYDHAAGDQVLLTMAEVLRKHSGEGVLVSRFGGDEFVLLFPNTVREQAFLRMENIRQVLANTVVELPTGEKILPFSTSAGIASFSIDGRTQAELLRKADQALYRAKVAGRNQVRLAYEERMVPKTAHFTQTQLERLTKLADEHGVSEADLLREAMDDLLTKYGVNDIKS